MGRLTDISTNITISQACFWLMWYPCPCQKHAYVIPPSSIHFFQDFVCSKHSLIVDFEHCLSADLVQLLCYGHKTTNYPNTFLKPLPHSAYVAWHRSSGEKWPLSHEWYHHWVMRSDYMASSKTAAQLQYRAFFCFWKKFKLATWCPCNHRQC